jgi:hypothetical protein
MLRKLDEWRSGLWLGFSWTLLLLPHTSFHPFTERTASASWSNDPSRSFTKTVSLMRSSPGQPATVQFSYRLALYIFQFRERRVGAV